MDKIAKSFLTYLVAKCIAEIVFEADRFIKNDNEATLLVCKAVCKSMANVLDEMNGYDIEKIRGE